MKLQVFWETLGRKEGGVSTSCSTVAMDLEEKSSSHLLFQVKHLCLHIVGSGRHQFKLPAGLKLFLPVWEGTLCSGISILAAYL